VLPVSVENTVRLSTTAPGGNSGYATNPFVGAMLGADLGGAYASFLARKGYQSSFVWMLTPANLIAGGVREDHVEVRRVGVGGFGNVDNLKRHRPMRRRPGSRSTRDCHRKQRGK